MQQWLRDKLQQLHRTQSCLLCLNRSSTPLCAACSADLPALQHHCERCAIPLSSAHTLCGACITKPPYYHQVYCPFRYDVPVSSFITRLKFQQQLHVLPLLGELLSDHLQQTLTQKPELLLAVPMHVKGMRQRGFNQSHEIAKIVSRKLGIPLASNLLVRQKHGARQAELKRRDRLNNLRQTFKIHGNLPARHIMIVDDVMTTGTTVNTLAKLLQRVGADRVDIAVLARTP